MYRWYWIIIIKKIVNIKLNGWKIKVRIKIKVFIKKKLKFRIRNIRLEDLILEFRKEGK